jgi:GNAT superfamily N-acetyltransferase
MVEPEIILRAATAGDAAAMADVDRQSWPAQLATTADEFAARIAAYADGQLVAISAGRVVGTASAQRITAEFLAARSGSYDSITDDNCFTHSHTGRGEIYQLIGVGVLPEVRGRRLGRMLVDRQIELARSLNGVQRIVGFTRPAAYSQHPGIPIKEYVQARDSNGNLLDPVLAFHIEAGARIVSVHANFRPSDSDACGHGVLIEYASSSC